MQYAEMAKRYLLSCPAFAELPIFMRNEKAAASLFDMLDRMENSASEITWNIYFAKLCACTLSGDNAKLNDCIDRILKDKKMRSYQKVLKPMIGLSQSMAENKLSQAYSDFSILEELSMLSPDERALLLVCKEFLATKIMTIVVCTCKKFNRMVMRDHFYRLGFEDFTVVNYILPYFNPGILKEISEKQTTKAWVEIDREAADLFFEQYNHEFFEEMTLKTINALSMLDNFGDGVVIRGQLNVKYLKRRSSRCLDTLLPAPSKRFKTGI